MANTAFSFRLSAVCLGLAASLCAQTAPVPSAVDVVDPKGPPIGSFKVLRGGCWFFYDKDCRSAYRLRREPSLRNCIFGFRLACADANQRLAAADSRK